MGRDGFPYPIPRASTGRKIGSNGRRRTTTRGDLNRKEKIKQRGNLFFCERTPSHHRVITQSSREELFHADSTFDDRLFFFFLCRRKREDVSVSLRRFWFSCSPEARFLRCRRADIQLLYKTYSCLSSAGVSVYRGLYVKAEEEEEHDSAQTRGVRTVHSSHADRTLKEESSRASSTS